MKLLFDQNLSHRLVPLLADAFPGSMHVRELRELLLRGSVIQIEKFVADSDAAFLLLR